MQKTNPFIIQYHTILYKGVVVMKTELRQIYITKEANDLLNQVDTRTPKYIIASKIITSSIIKKK
jgi:hypothetical protein